MSRLLWTGVLAGLLAHAFLGISGVGRNSSLENALLVLAIGLSGLACIWRALANRTERVAWSLLGAGILLDAAGQLYYYALQDPAETFPALSDILLLSFYPCAIAAITLLVRERLRSVDASLWLDGLIAGATIAALGIEFVVGRIGDHGPVGPMVVYPIVDVTVLGLLVAAWGASGWRASSGPVCLTAGFLLLLATDAIGVNQISSSSYVPGTLLDSGWPAAMGLIGFASTRPWWRTVKIDESFGWALFVLPLTAALGGLTVVTLESINDRQGLAFVLGCVGILLVVCRLFMSLRENAMTARDLQVARDRFKKAFEDAPIGMVMLGLGSEDFGRFIDVNRAFTELSGYSEEELLESDLVVLTHPDDREDTIETLREVASGIRSRIEKESRYIRADGQTIVVQVNASTVKDDSGHAVYKLAQVQDITARKQHEREHELLGAIVGSSEDAIFSKTVEGVVTTWNPGAEKLYGYTAEEACGRKVGDLIIPESQAGDELGVIRQVLSGHPVRHYETERKRKDGTVITVSLSASPVKDSDGHFVGVSVIARDITERKRRELEMLQDVTEYSWLQRLRRAIDENHLCLYSQPIMDLKTGEFTREEILLRMRGERGENDIIGPGEFLPVAEKFDLVGEIDRWIVSETIPLLAARNQIELNLSAHSIGDPVLTRLIEKLLIETGADPSKLTIEITETAVMSDLQAARMFAERLERLGCSLALDDFGTGYGSFTYLKHLPVQYLKLDIQFIRDLVNSKADQQIVQSIVGVAKYFGVKTIAEGVESEQTMDLLANYGVDYAQGYFLGRPSPVVADRASTVDGPVEPVI